MAFIVSSLPGTGGGNPYIELFYGALRPFGVELYAEPTIDLSWGSEHFANIDALHVHWPEYIWRDYWAPPPDRPLRRFVRSNVPGAWRVYDAIERAMVASTHSGLRAQLDKWRGLSNFLDFVRAARRANLRIIWTLHNLESHEDWQFVDRFGFHRFAHLTDLIICHSQHARAACLRLYRPQCPVVVMPHGNYDGVYPPPRSRHDVLLELGLNPSLPVAGCIGALRYYKGFDVACDAVRLLRGRVQLLCAGAPYHGFDLEGFQRMAAAAPGVALVAHQLNAQEFSDYTSACDIILLPYRKTTGSGVLLAALTFGKGVVASDFPFFREVLAGSTDAGRLVAPDSAEALAWGIEDLLRIPASCRMSAARVAAERYAWPIVIQPVATYLTGMNS